MTDDTSTATWVLPTLVNGSLARGIVVERQRAALRGEVVGPQPVLADHDRVGRDGANLLDEAREMEGYLRIGRAIIGDRRSDGLRCPEFIDLHHHRAVGLPEALMM